MDIARNNAIARGNACNPILFEPMMMTYYWNNKKIIALQKKIDALLVANLTA
jgi:hypothetical protein